MSGIRVVWHMNMQSNVQFLPLTIKYVHKFLPTTDRQNNCLIDSKKFRQMGGQTDILNYTL